MTYLLCFCSDFVMKLTEIARFSRNLETYFPGIWPKPVFLVSVCSWYMDTTHHFHCTTNDLEEDDFCQIH